MRLPAKLIAQAILALLPVICFATQPPASDIDYRQRAKQEFVTYDPRYLASRAERVAQARVLGRQVFEREAAGKPSQCSHQILNEVSWLLGYTADFHEVDRRLEDLKATLAHPERESAAVEQDPADGSWGHCYNAWFFKLDASFDHLRELAKSGQPPYKPSFLDRINSPAKLTSYLTSISVSDIPRTGVDHRRELNESLADLLRLILDGVPRNYALDPGLRQTITDLVLHDIRNPATGWWGERYVRDGGTAFVDDISITFHMVRYLDGNVPDLAKVADTALAVKDLDYHVGWLEDGEYTNHNNMDAAVLFKYTWPFTTAEQKRAMGDEIRKMLNWCLRDSLLPDGSFKPGSDDQDSVEEQTYFGVAFLSRTGFFDKAERFWTTDDLPDAGEIQHRIAANIARHRSSGGAGGEYYRNALELLPTPPPATTASPRK
jgi:hypothetical protein